MELDFYPHGHILWPYSLTGLVPFHAKTLQITNSATYYFFPTSLHQAYNLEYYLCHTCTVLINLFYTYLCTIKGFNANCFCTSFLLLHCILLASI